MSVPLPTEGAIVIQEFKDFVNRGNVLDLAVAVVLGAAFGAVVTSFVDNVLMQVIAAIGGQPDFSALAIDIGDGKILYGAFLNVVISFLFISFGVFLVVKAVNQFRKPDEQVEVGPTEIEVLTEIRDALQRQS